jgi:hypothetical protein
MPALEGSQPRKDATGSDEEVIATQALLRTCCVGLRLAAISCNSVGIFS